MEKVLLIFFILFTFTISCKFNKEPLSSEKFKPVIDKNGFSIVNVHIPQSSENYSAEEILVKNVLYGKEWIFY